MTELVGGRFEIEREAGAGAMARVFRARDVTTGGVVALKILNGVGEHTMRRFAREAAALAELQHPGIVRYIAHGQAASGHPFLAMEWLDGESLEQRLERGPLTAADALALALALAAALGAAHARGSVHRDVKPANIFLVDSDPARPKLLDFGLVRDLDATFALTNTGDLLGTPLFMAPEQARCEAALDSRVDVYALGAVLYACLAGRPPLVASNVVGLLAKIVLDEPPPPSTFAPALSAAIDELVMLLIANARWFEAAGLVITAAGQLGDNELVDFWVERAMEQEPEADAVAAFVLCLSRGSAQLAWSDRIELARGALARADALARPGIGPSAAARLELARAYLLQTEARYDACIARLHRVAATYSRIGAARDALQASMLAHMLSGLVGHLDTAFPTLVQYVEQAERLEARYLADWTRCEVAIALLIKGLTASAEAELAKVPARIVEQPLFHGGVTLFRAWAAYIGDDIDQLQHIVSASAAKLTYARFRAARDAFAAYACLRNGDPASACDQARAAIAALLEAPSMRTDGCMAAFAPALDTLVRAGAPDAASAVAAHVARLEAMAAAMVEPGAGDAFMHRVPWNRRVLDLATPPSPPDRVST